MLPDNQRHGCTGEARGTPWSRSGRRSLSETLTKARTCHGPTGTNQPVKAADAGRPDPRKRLGQGVVLTKYFERVTGILIAASLPVTQLGRANRVNATSGRRHPREPEVLDERSSVHLQHG
jgi:hypothetical protein